MPPQHDSLVLRLITHISTFLRCFGFQAVVEVQKPGSFQPERKLAALSIHGWRVGEGRGVGWRGGGVNSSGSSCLGLLSLLKKQKIGSDDLFLTEVNRDNKMPSSRWHVGTLTAHSTTVENDALTYQRTRR